MEDQVNQPEYSLLSEKISEAHEKLAAQGENLHELEKQRTTIWEKVDQLRDEQRDAALQFSEFKGSISARVMEIKEGLTNRLTALETKITSYAVIMGFIAGICGSVLTAFVVARMNKADHAPVVSKR